MTKKKRAAGELEYVGLEGRVVQARVVASDMVTYLCGGGIGS